MFNDPYLKELTRYLHTSQNSQDSQSPSHGTEETYRENFENLDLDNDAELKTAVELIEK